MSLRAIFDIVIHLDSFRNIDLFQQGIYYLNFQVYHQQGEQVFYAAPYNILCKEPTNSKDVHLISPGQPEELGFSSRSFLIKYCDEEIDINEIGVFRCEVELSQDFEIIPITVEVNLMFHDFVGRIDQTTLDNFRKSPPGFVCASSTKVHLWNIMEGVNQFWPINFDELHTCLVNTSFHGVLIDFRFRPKPQLSFGQEQLQSLKHTSKPQELDISKCLAEYLFHQKKEASAQEIDSVYNSYIKRMLFIHKKNKQLMETWTQKCPKVPESPNEKTSLLSEKVEIRDTKVVAELILQEIQEVAVLMHKFVATFIDFIYNSHKIVNAHLQTEFNETLKDKLGESIFRDVKSVKEFALTSDSEIGNRHRVVSRTVRKNPYYKNITPMPAMQVSYFPERKEHPILFHDVVTKDSDTSLSLTWDPKCFSYIQNNTGGKHLYVLVHGFQGNAFDMRMMRNSILMLKPNALILCSHMNEGETDGDIREMGITLSQEVTNYILDFCPRDLKKISFIGHSLGGLIIRAALPHLVQYSDKMHTFMTFSSPHLGYMYNSSKLVDAGMWFLKKWKKVKSLKQLTMADSSVLEETFLYQLSSYPGLEFFKYVALVSSMQDNYSPFESSRIEVGPKASTDPNKGRLYIKMATNILSSLAVNKLYRLDVNFKIQKKNFDNWIGRAAHIKMLECETTMKMIMYACPELIE